MKKKIIDTIGLIIISVTIAIFNFIIGANEKGLRILPIAILLSLMLIYLVIRKLVFKQKIVIKNKIDIFVLLFMLTTTLPYIFKTYSTLQGTIEFIWKYFFVYATYLTIRNTIDTKGKTNIIIAVTIVSSLIIGVLGIDIQNNKYFRELLVKFNLHYTDDYVLFSTFGYANTVAIYFSFCIFLAISQIQNTSKKIIKILYSFYMIFAFYVIYKTLSKAVFALLVGAIFLYIIIINIENIKKYRKKLGKILIILVILAILAIVFVFGIGLKLTKPYEFTDAYWQKNFNYKFKPNQTYTIKLNLETKNKSNYNGENFEISILEMNEYFNEKELINKKMGDFKGEQQLTFTTTKDLYTIDIKIENRNKGNVIIEKCYINDLEYPINFKFLPYQLGDILTSYSLVDKSIVQRLDFWQDCIKMAKESPIIGQGGDTWKRLSQAVQEYPYGIKETHSYLFELLICYGIVGVILFLTLIIAFNNKIIDEYVKNKEKIKYKIPIFIGLNLIIMHSLFFDFNMSFIVILITVFGYMAILMYDSEEQIKTLKIVDYLVLIFLFIILVNYILANIAYYGIEDKELRKKLGYYAAYYKYEYIYQCINKNKEPRYILKEIQELIQEEPYYFQTEVYNKYWDNLLKNLDKFNEEELTQYLLFINEKYKTVKFVTPMYIDTILPRVYTMKNAYIKLNKINYQNEELKQQIEELRKIIENEYEINIVNIKATERNGASEGTINRIENEYVKIIQSIE